MTTQQTAVQRYRRPRGQYQKRRDSERGPKPLPEYLEAHDVAALIRAAPNPRASLLMLIQWRAGLRVSEALALEVRDLSLDSDLPTIHVRQGKGSKPRVVPVHPELHAGLASALQFGNIAQGDRIVKASRSTADRWIRSAAARAESDFTWAAHLEPYATAFLRSTSTGERDTYKLPEPLVGSFFDSDHANLSGAGAGSHSESRWDSVSV